MMCGELPMIHHIPKLKIVDVETMQFKKKSLKRRLNVLAPVLMGRCPALPAAPAAAPCQALGLLAMLKRMLLFARLQARRSLAHAKLTAVVATGRKGDPESVVKDVEEL